MKKILLAIFALLPVLTTFAQTDWTSPTTKFDQYWMIGLKTGFAQFHGDVSDKSFFSKLNKESKGSFGISLGRQITPALSIKVGYSSSNYFSKGSQLWAYDTINKKHLSVSGKISELGLSGELNLNKVFNKNAGNNWYAYFSGGLGYTNWTCDLKDEDLSTKDSVRWVAHVKNSKYTNVTVPKLSANIGFLNKLSFSLAFGAHFQLTDMIGMSVEHKYIIAGSDLLDGYSSGYTDVITTTTLGVIINLQKLSSSLSKDTRVKPVSYSTTQSKPLKSERRSILRGTPKTKPEIQEYTGYNALLPPPQPKIDTSRKVKSGLPNSGKNVWVAEADSGQLQITGSGKVTNDVYVGTDPQIASDIKTGLVPTYRIQIQASKTYIQVESVIKKLDLKEKVSVELRSDGWYRYYVGQYALLPDARAKLAEMRAKGLKDSFIVSFKTNTRKVIK